MQALTSKQKQHLKALAHSLSPVVQVGKNGVTEAILKDVNQALSDHELIKVQVLETSPTERVEVAMMLADKGSATVLGQIGRIVILYRPDDKEPCIQLP